MVRQKLGAEGEYGTVINKLYSLEETTGDKILNHTYQYQHRHSGAGVNCACKDITAQCESVDAQTGTKIWVFSMKAFVECPTRFFIFRTFLPKFFFLFKLNLL